MLEHENVQGVVESLKVITADNTRRLVTYAFEYAITNNRKKVCVSLPIKFIDEIYL